MIKKAILPAMIAGMLAVSVAVPAYPVQASTIADSVREQMQETEDGKTIAEKIQEQVGGTDSEEEQIEEAPITETEDEDIPTLIEGIDMSTAEGVTAAIEAIRGQSRISLADLRAIRQAYSALPMSEQVLVTNIDVLEAEEVRKGIAGTTDSSGTGAQNGPTNTNRPDTENKLRSNMYTIGISQASPSASVVVRFITDADGDGRNDVPDIVFMCPDTEEIRIDLTAPEIYSEKINAAVTVTDNFAQFDIASADTGSWTIKTSAEVIFEKMEYQGVREEPHNLTDSEVTAEPGEPQPVRESFLTRYGKLIGVCTVFAILIFLALTLPKRLVGNDGMEDDEEKKKKKDKEKNRKNTEKAGQEDAKEGRARKLTEDEEIAQIRAEFEAQQKQYERMDAENEERVRKIEESKKKEKTPDEVFYVTQQDIDNDDSIEEYDEGFGTGLLIRENDSVSSDTGEFPDRFGKP